MKISNYIINQGDTIELLAQVLLGSRSRVDELITLNSLRFPYISDDPVNQFANSKGIVVLDGSFTDASSVVINNINTLNIQMNDVVTLSQGSSFSYGVVSDVNGSTLSFASPLVGTFSEAAIVKIFSDQQNITTKVLKTGDSLYLPIDRTSSVANADTFGTDLKIDSNGFLVKSNGQIATVAGFDNLFQSIEKRLRTSIGALKLHPTYGNKLFRVIGESGTSYFSGLARHYVVECASEDPRVQSVSVSDFSMIEDSLEMTISVLPLGSKTSVSRTLSISTGGA